MHASHTWRSTRTRWAAGLMVASADAGCGSNTPADPTDPSSSLAGSYHATVFNVTPTGQAAIDVLAANGSLAITIGAANALSGLLSIPASVTGGSALNADMAGTVVVTGATVTFQQNADTFVRDLEWTRVGTSLTVVAQAAGSASFTITLARL